ncbi:sensor histidine kinase [Streptomyces sp. ST1015]|uniref:sensor histidine kinase n=1 Tax=Streptomyces sp. ST1015 TaxID=1848900 RepID=UPI001CA7026F|nr:sensor histidine kinase [Streptomyces sp. ST1015]QZZ28359.1 sensor histidine kinase [Streptomyces sp. ST1015]
MGRDERARDVWEGLAGRGYLLSPWPWRAVLYLLTGTVTGAFVLVGLALLAVVGSVLAVVLVGLPLLGCLAFAGLPVAALERRRLRLVDREEAPGAHAEPAVPGLRGWLAVRARERATWRELGHALLTACLWWPAEAVLLALALGGPLTMIAAPVLFGTVGGGRETKVLKVWTVTGWPTAFAACLGGVVLLAAGLYVIGVAAGARGALTRLLVTPRASDLGARVTELTRSRARLVDAFEAERRRIERDLHDGAQQRLVALSMALGLARLDAPPGSPLATQLARAHEEAGAALAELRELIQGIHPRVLVDHGLPAAVADVADRSPVPVDTHCALPGRLPDAVEATVYFVVREALANVAKHSGAGRAWIRVEQRGARLVVEVGDDGRGGADSAAGTGITGLADRVSVAGGRLALTSPAGGPTVLRAELPCAAGR